MLHKGDNMKRKRWIILVALILLGGYVLMGCSQPIQSAKALDIDKDGLTNEEESKYGTDPEKPDTDNDGLKDGDEVKIYGTSPVDFDTDGDGIGDGDEVLKYKTDPKNMDTDHDGLKDGDEIKSYQTNPLKDDTDSDNLKDGEEIRIGTNPLEKRFR